MGAGGSWWSREHDAAATNTTPLYEGRLDLWDLLDGDLVAPTPPQQGEERAPVVARAAMW